MVNRITIKGEVVDYSLENGEFRAVIYDEESGIKFPIYEPVKDVYMYIINNMDTKWLTYTGHFNGDLHTLYLDAVE